MAARQDWQWDDEDAAIAAAMQARLPAFIYDAHAHVYQLPSLKQHWRPLESGPADAGIAAWRTHVGRQVGAQRLTGGLFFPFPQNEPDLPLLNRELIAELKREPESRGLMLVSHKMSRETAEELLAHPQIVGFKPYHLMATTTPTFEADIDAFLPSWAWELADREGGVIMLHMVRDLALSDPRNEAEILTNCRRYPNAQLILAHAARGFHAPNTTDAIERYTELENLWFDASGICEAAPIAAILRAFGPRKMMWASDFPISDRAGLCTTVGKSFAWMTPERIDEGPTAPPLRAWPVGLENLRAVLEAADLCFLNDDDLADVFCHNARRLLKLPRVGTPAPDAQAIYEHAKRRLPGGSQLLSKRPEMMAPGQWPPYFTEARGVQCWDLAGRRYWDFSLHGGGATLLGFRDPVVTRAVQRRVALGSFSTLNPVDDVTLADRLCEIHPWAEAVRYARTGGEATAVAVRIARATTRKQKVAICGYHGWTDWYLAANLGDNDALDGHLLAGLAPRGVPRALAGTTLPFRYGDREAFDAVIAASGDEMAAVVMEPCRSVFPEPGYLEHIRRVTRERGILLIFDEITIGWRLTFGGAHLLLGVNPDIAVFGKIMGNGHPMAAVIGTDPAMVGAHESFISSLYWTDGVGPAAALATLDRLQELRVPEVVAATGKRIRKLLVDAAAAHGVGLTVSGFDCALILKFDGADSQAVRTLYTQYMLDEDILAGALIYVTYAHDDVALGHFARALDRAMPRLARAIADDRVHAELKGEVAHSGFSRLI